LLPQIRFFKEFGEGTNQFLSFSKVLPTGGAVRRCDARPPELLAEVAETCRVNAPLSYREAPAEHKSSCTLQGRAPLSQNRKCERCWTLPSIPVGDRADVVHDRIPLPSEGVSKSAV